MPHRTCNLMRPLPGGPRPIRLPQITRLSLLQRFALASLVVFLILGVGTAYFLSRSIERSALNDAAWAAYDNLHTRLLRQFKPQSVTAPMSDARYFSFEQFVNDSILS